MMQHPTLIVGIFTFGLLSSAESTDSLVRIQRCRKFLEIAEMEGAGVLLEKPEYAKAYEICREMINSGWDKANSLGKGSNVGGRGGSLGDLGRRGFRRAPGRGSLDAGGGCSIEFFSRPHFQGARHSVAGSRRRLRSMGERSIRTLGDCCWAIFWYYLSRTCSKGEWSATPSSRSRGFRRLSSRPDGGRVVIRPGQNLTNASDWGWRPGRVRSVAKLSKC